MMSYATYTEIVRLVRFQKLVEVNRNVYNISFFTSILKEIGLHMEEI